MNGIQVRYVAPILWFAVLLWLGFGAVVTPGAVVFLSLSGYALLWLIWPQSWIARPWRFLAGLIYVALWGTIPGLHPEGRSMRLSFRRAVAYAWAVSA